MDVEQPAAFCDREMKKRLTNILTVIISTLLALVIGESILEWRSVPNDNYVWIPNFSVKLNINEPSMPGVVGTSEFNINTDGVRGAEYNASADHQLLMIGGSTTECFFLDDEEAWPYLVERQLNKGDKSYWIGNLGRSGLNTEHHILTLKEGINRFEGLDGIVFLVGINDLIKDLNRGVASADKRSFEDQTFMLRTVKEDSLPFWKRLEIVKLFDQAKSPTDTVPEALVQDRQGLIYDKWRDNRANRKSWVDVVPDLSTERKAFEKRVNQLINICEFKGIQPYFILQPTMYDDRLEEKYERLLWMGGIGNFQGDEQCDYYTSRVMKELMSTYNGIISDVCKKRKVPCLDAPSQLSKDTTVFYDDCHFNEQGARSLAKLVTKFIEQHAN